MDLWQFQRLPARTLSSLIMTVTSLYLYSSKICDNRNERDELEKGRLILRKQPGEKELGVTPFSN